MVHGVEASRPIAVINRLVINRLVFDFIKAWAQDG